MQPTYDVHLIFNNRERRLIEPIDTALRARGLNPWFWERDIVGGDVTEVEERSIRSTPVSAVFLGSELWGSFHARYARMALELGRPIVPVLLPDCPPAALEAEDRLFHRLTSAWVRLESVEDATELNELAQRIVDATISHRLPLASTWMTDAPEPGRALQPCARRDRGRAAADRLRSSALTNAGKVAIAPQASGSRANSRGFCLASPSLRSRCLVARRDGEVCARP